MSTNKLLVPSFQGGDSIREAFQRQMTGQGAFKQGDFNILPNGSYENEGVRSHWMTWKGAIWRRSWFPKPQLVGSAEMVG